MIKYQLRCTQSHEFEAWFRDSETYDRQEAASEIACPMCGGRQVGKAIMAPAIGRTRGGDKVERAQQVAAVMMRQLRDLRRTVEEKCDYVGDRFAEEARRIHYGETPHRDIYGETTDEEARELQEEGVSFARIPWVPTTDS